APHPPVKRKQVVNLCYHVLISVLKEWTTSLFLDFTFGFLVFQCKTLACPSLPLNLHLISALDLLGGADGLCHYKCRDGSKPVPRYGYRPAPPNGCGSPVFGLHFDIGIPSMTKCCNQHDRCYDSCGMMKNDCDEQFQNCLSKICTDVQKTLGISESVKACETTVGLLFDAVIHLGCKPYLESQRAACICQYEEKIDL
uniref:Group XIIA secretory phospholipase A2 n=1 Tax=Xenopus tropicalis TaxID=8364 RepID=A0A803JMU3_XENTR